jgi:hypothetical protein
MAGAAGSAGHRSVDTCQAFSAAGIRPRAGMIAIRLSVLSAWHGKPFARVAPHVAQADRLLTCSPRRLADARTSAMRTSPARPTS